MSESKDKVLLTMNQWHIRALNRLAKQNGMTKSGLVRFLIMKLARGEIKI